MCRHVRPYSQDGPDSVISLAYMIQALVPRLGDGACYDAGKVGVCHGGKDNMGTAAMLMSAFDAVDGSHRRHRYMPIFSAVADWFESA